LIAEFHILAALILRKDRRPLEVWVRSRNESRGGVGKDLDQESSHDRAIPFPGKE